MGLKELFSKGITKSQKFKEMQENRRIQQIIEEREKGADERELERFHEEERQKSIKRNLEEFRKHRQKEAMETNILKGPNIFKGENNMMKNNDKLLSMSTKLNGGSMFFK